MARLRAVSWHVPFRARIAVTCLLLPLCSPSMLDIARENGAEGDLCLADMGQGFGFRTGMFDGVIRSVFQGRAAQRMQLLSKCPFIMPTHMFSFAGMQHFGIAVAVLLGADRSQRTEALALLFRMFVQVSAPRCQVRACVLASAIGRRVFHGGRMMLRTGVEFPRAGR